MDYISLLSAIVGSLVGGWATYIAVEHTDKKNQIKANELARELLLTIKKSWEEYERLDRGSSLQLDGYNNLKFFSESIINKVLESSNKDLIDVHFKIMEQIKKQNIILSNKQLGLANYQVDEIKNLFDRIFK